MKFEIKSAPGLFRSKRIAQSADEETHLKPNCVILSVTNIKRGDICAQSLQYSEYNYCNFNGKNGAQHRHFINILRTIGIVIIGYVDALCGSLTR